MSDNVSSSSFGRRRLVIAGGLILLSVAVFVFSTVVSKSKALANQKNVLAALRAKGAYCYREPSLLGEFYRPWGNGPVTKIHLLGPQFDDSDVERLAVCPDLKDLGLSNSSVTDTGMKSICQFSKLETMTLNGTQITDAAIKQLSRLPNLKSVNLMNTQITAGGLKLLGDSESVTDITAGQSITLARAAVEELRNAWQGKPRLHY